MDNSVFLFSSASHGGASSFLREYLSNSNINNADDSTFCLLNKASIIHSIRQRTANCSLPEGILDSLQIIEQLDRQQGLPISDSMRAAFCALAVHYTLTSLPHSWPCFFDAVQRIWRFRIRNIEDSGTSQLLGPDLRKWRDEIEAALWDNEISHKLLGINTQDEALRAIRVYLEEACSSMKPAFVRLELASPAGPTIDPVPAQSPPCCTDKGKRIMGVNSQTRFKLRSSHRRYKGPVIISASEEDEPSCSKYGSLSTPEVNKLQDELNSSTLEAGVTDPLPKALEVTETDEVASNLARKNLHTKGIVEDCNKDKGVPATSTDVPSTSFNPTMRHAQAEEGNQGTQAFIQQNKVNRPSLIERNVSDQAPAHRHHYINNGKGILKVNSQTRCKLRSSHRHHKGLVIIADSEEGRPSCNKYVSLSTPEIKQLQDALKSSNADLRAAVTDPLPEALEVAERVASYMAWKNLHAKSIVEEGHKDKGVPATSGNPTVDVLETSVNCTIESAQANWIAADIAGKNLCVKALGEDNSKMDRSVPPPSVNPSRVPAQDKEGSQGNQGSLHQNKPSLMERNCTARTYEWEDSIDVSTEETASCSNKCRLPSPKTKHVSPLKEHVIRKWVRKRKMNRWSIDEEKALQEGVLNLIMKVWNELDTYFIVQSWSIRKQNFW
ncbi:uncharacterized protein LOC111281160 isoform X2 [Durio zibethinus]|uniref:Uncharacterized protein LOC111281160 isoform X2 n=1 Tax=Durio zibethinus TaxID=66656 RepID=A0A6P5X8K1_DURZI|nr:uncharacterized protein LOC111281160 isoform X2 [Durio zibethinus]